MIAKKKHLIITFGILVGYVFAALINVLCFDKSFIEAITDIRLIFLLVGVLVSFWLIKRNKSN